MAAEYCRKERSKQVGKDKKIKLPYLISDGMVLQQNSRIKIWGEASPSKSLKVEFKEKEYTTITGEDGRWELTMEALKAGGPHDMIIYCQGERVRVKDIMVGEVWVLGGQSNMEMPFERVLDLFEEEVNLAQYPYVRKFAFPEAYNFQEQEEELKGGEWISLSPKTVFTFSAVGYFFAKKIYDKYKIPIGLVHTAVGGTPAEAWISEEALDGFPHFQAILSLCKDKDYIKKIQDKDTACKNEWYSKTNDGDRGFLDTPPWYSTAYDDREWSCMELPRSFQDTELEVVRGTVWFRKEFLIREEIKAEEARLVLGTIINGDETYINGTKVGSNDSLFAKRRYKIPQGVLKPGKNLIAVRVIITRHMGAFITDMPYYISIQDVQIPLNGSWKYRIGKINKELEPATTFIMKPSGAYNSMIYPLRKYSIKGVLWYQGESNTEYTADYEELFKMVIKTWRDTWNMGNFPFLYVQLANYCPWRKEPKISKWAQIRDAQRRVLDVKNTGMAAIYDAGEYNDIHPRDKKTVGDRLALLAMNLVYKEDLEASGPLYQHREIEGDKIRVYFTHAEGLHARGESLNDFTICGKDGIFKSAKALIQGITVLLSNSEIKEPLDVRYGWKDNPEEANLYNKAGLPASPFTTEYEKNCT